MKRILCFGDSLTWGFDPATRTRFDEDSRWPCVMQQALGGDYKVIEEGQNGRTIATEDPAEGEKNGLKYLGPCLESHTPLDYVIVMLGSNDCKRKFAYSSMDIAGGSATASAMRIQSSFQKNSHRGTSSLRTCTGVFSLMRQSM